MSLCIKCTTGLKKMKSLTLGFSEPRYYELVTLAAHEQQDVEEFAKSHLLSLIDEEGDSTEGLSFEDKILEEFDLDPGTMTSANVIGVCKRMREGMEWKEAYTDRAQEYSSDNPEIENAETYSDTVRDCCTRRLGFTTGEFRQRVNELIEDSSESSQDIGGLSSQSTTGPDGNLGYRVTISSAEEVVASFGEDPSKDQSEVMKEVVDYLIEEYDLIDHIQIPYVVEKKALINDTPTYPDGEEQMRHYKQLSNEYYLDTHYKREDKMNRMTDLAGECGLGTTFGDRWKR